jgi:hypothetical protein
MQIKRDQQLIVITQWTIIENLLLIGTFHGNDYKYKRKKDHKENHFSTNFWRNYHNMQIENVNKKRLYYKMDI